MITKPVLSLPAPPTATFSKRTCNGVEAEQLLKTYKHPTAPGEGDDWTTYFQLNAERLGRITYWARVNPDEMMQYIEGFLAKCQNYEWVFNRSRMLDIVQVGMSYRVPVESLARYTDEELAQIAGLHVLAQPGRLRALPDSIRFRLCQLGYKYQGS